MKHPCASPGCTRGAAKEAKRQTRTCARAGCGRTFQRYGNKRWCSTRCRDVANRKGEASSWHQEFYQSSGRLGRIALYTERAEKAAEAVKAGQSPEPIFQEAREREPLTAPRGGAKKSYA